MEKTTDIFAPPSISPVRILFIGQAPSRDTDGKPPFTGRCGAFLAEKLLNMSQGEMLKCHDFKNVLSRWPGKGAGGDKFPMAEARIAAEALIPLMKDRTVVLLGYNVARAFNIQAFTYLQCYVFRHRGVEVTQDMYVIPHPSGINRHWNDRTNIDEARKLLRFISFKVSREQR